MSSPWQQSRNRAVQATILAALLWLGRLGFGWRWLLFPVLAALVFAVIWFGYAALLWWFDRHPDSTHKK